MNLRSRSDQLRTTGKCVISAAQERVAAAVAGMRDEIHGLNERIDRFIVGVFNREG